MGRGERFFFRIKNYVISVSCPKIFVEIRRFWLVDTSFREKSIRINHIDVFRPTAVQQAWTQLYIGCGSCLLIPSDSFAFRNKFSMYTCYAFLIIFVYNNFCNYLI